ncbi:MAG: H-type lectin domain-containing protein [Shimia sp.]
MKRLRNHHIGIDQGELTLFSDFEEDGEMWAGEGERMIRGSIAFRETFRTPPAVTVGLAMWDVDTSNNVRMDLTTEKVTEAGCVVLFKTWGDTRIARVRANWMAIGELRHADEWELY